MTRLPRWMRSTLFGAAWLLVLLTATAGADTPQNSFTDDLGRRIVLEALPQRAVSLVPGLTEILFALGAGDRVIGVTYHDTWPPEVSQKAVVGGFLSPSPERITALKPDVVLASPLHRDLVERLESTGIPVVVFRTASLADSFETIKTLGDVFGCASAAHALVAHIQDQLARIRRKTAAIAPGDRLRTIRFMGRDAVMTPGADSFQNEMIRAAGGVPPPFVGPGPVTSVTQAQWQDFDPQVIYGCKDDRKAAERLLMRPGWRDVSAVRHHRILYFPCELTCRASAHSGDFVAWLSSRLYSRRFSDPSVQIDPDRVLSRRDIDLDIGYVERAVVVESRIRDFVHKTLLVDFNRPMAVVSTLAGSLDGVKTVGNHYLPPPSWSLGHDGGVQGLHRQVCTVVGRDAGTTALLFTGADMDHLSIQRRRYREMDVTALVTAGVSSNAVRMSRDTGDYYEPGTINIVILPGMQLTARAMARAIISATEAKTAALTDLDIRSTRSPRYAATGTGTDNIIVAAGQGHRIDNAGGHSKMGQLVADAVYAGVTEAVYRQNGLTAGRPIIQRLKERGITIHGLLGELNCDCVADRGQTAAAAEAALAEPRYAGFVAAALAIGDAQQQGLVNDLSLFEQWALDMASEIAGMPVVSLEPRASREVMPLPVAMALDAVINGVLLRARIENQ